MKTIARSRTLLMRMGVTILLTLLIGATGAAAGKPKKPKTPMPEMLRCFDAQLMDLIQQGLARSATLQELTSHLERAGVIVYLSYGHQMPEVTAGRTRLMAASGTHCLKLAIAVFRSKLPRVA